MRRFRFERLFFLTLSFNAALALAWAGPMLAQSGATPDSEAEGKKVIEEAVQALGGEAYLRVRDIRSSGRFWQFRKGEVSAGGKFVDYVKYPDKERTEFGSKKDLLIVVNNGDQGWTLEADTVTEQPKDDIERFKRNLLHDVDYILRLRMKSEKFIIRYEGTELLDTQRVKIVELTDASKDRVRISFDANTKLPVRIQFRAPHPRLAAMVDEETHYANFHRIQGVMVQFYQSSHRDGEKVFEVFFDNFQFNSGLPDSLFTKPVPTTTPRKK